MIVFNSCLLYRILWGRFLPKLIRTLGTTCTLVSSDQRGEQAVYLANSLGSEQLLGSGRADQNLLLVAS